MLSVLNAPATAHWMDAPATSDTSSLDQDIEQRIRDMSASDVNENALASDRLTTKPTQQQRAERDLRPQACLASDPNAPN
jgi:hypothetical protein